MDSIHRTQGPSQSTSRVYRLGWVWDGERLHEQVVLGVCGGRVEYLGSSEDPWPAEVAARFSHAKVFDMPNGLAMPGLVNAHHHAYSALARAMPVPNDLRDFRDVLERLWWPLDRSLSHETVELSALVTAMDSLRHGVTTVFDHHASPSVACGSLDLVARSFSGLGLRSLVCLEISDRFGDAGVEESLQENLSFAATQRDDPYARGILGLHASFTLSDNTLELIAAQSPEALPVHVHVAEDLCDVEHARSLGHRGPLARLASFGLLRPGSLVVHGVHLAIEEIPLLSGCGAHVVHNPASNANNRVGCADIARFPSDRVLLGTDGMSSDVLASLQAAFLGARASSSAPGEALQRAVAAGLCNPDAYVAASFGLPPARIAAGEEADFAIFDYASPTPVTQENFPAHLVFGLPNSGLARHVHAHGQLGIDDGAFVGLDEGAVLAEARCAGRVLWQRLSRS